MPVIGHEPQVKILIAVDGSDVSNEASKVAERLFPDAEHILLSAASVAPFLVPDPIGGGSMGMMPSEAAYETAEQDADRAVGLAREGLAGEVRSETPLGSPGPTICREATTLGVDVVVVGHGHKNWVSRLFEPSVSDYVIRHAPCPVLVISEHHSHDEQGANLT